MNCKKFLHLSVSLLESHRLPAIGTKIIPAVGAGAFSDSWGLNLARSLPKCCHEAYCPNMRVTHNKLVRDPIPETIQANGCCRVTPVLDGLSFRSALLAKLIDETREARIAPPEQLSGEQADVLEVI